MQYLILPGHGRIPCDVAGFRLLFLDGSGTIELDGDGIREKLTDLANYARAAEHSKRQQITNDGLIQDDIVRVIREIED
jgi:adenylylsulfate kinase-like enzyme